MDHKCRICFQTFHKHQKTIEISAEIKATFFSLTQIELCSSPMFSSIICWICWKELSTFEVYRKQTSQRQLELYKIFPASELKSEKLRTEFIEVNIKEEPEFDDGIFELSQRQTQNQSNEKVKHIGGDNKNLPTERKRKYTERIYEKRICSDCGIYYKRLGPHLKRYHSKRKRIFYCDMCGYNAIFKSRLAEHMFKHLPSSLKMTLRCHLCTFTTFYKSNFNKHIKNHESVSVEKHSCSVCDKTFKTKYELAIHVRGVHEKSVTFQCKFCPAIYYAKNHFKNHVTMQHLKKDIRDQICEVCAKAFVTLEQLGNHIKRSHIEGEHKCNNCPKTFHKKSLLDRHMTSHLKERKHQCQFCSSSFKFGPCLKRHIDSAHLKLRFYCEVPECKAVYIKRENYRIHLTKSHSEIMDKNLFEEIMKRARCMKPVQS